MTPERLTEIKKMLAKTFPTPSDMVLAREGAKELVAEVERLLEELSTTLVVHKLCVGCGDTAIGPWSRREETLALARDEGWIEDHCSACVEAGLR